MKSTQLKSLTALAALGLAATAAHASGGPMPAYAGCPGAGTFMYYGKPAVHLNFSSVILCNLQKNPNANALLAAMPDPELARLSYQIDRERQAFGAAFPATPTVADFLRMSAQRFTAANLGKIRSAFGAIDTDKAVAAYSSLSIQSAYFSTVHRAPIAFSRAKVQSVGGTVSTRGSVTAQGTVVASPVLDMTVYEVYLEYYTAGWTAEAAFAAAGIYVGANVAVAWAAGQAIGTGIYYGLDYVDENINIWIGDQVGGTVDFLCKAGACKKE